MNDQVKNIDPNGNLAVDTSIDIELSTRNQQLPKLTSASEDADAPFSMVWSNLSYSFERKVPVKGQSKRCKKQLTVHKVLKPMNGRINSGSITGILGPSGAGKTTLLNCLTGKVAGNIEGEYFIRASKELLGQLKNCRIGYVPQVDVLFTLFTVRETLLFASRLNNANWSYKKHTSHVINVLNSLQFTDHIDYPLYKLSGGQLKRTSIAVELVSQPIIIFLDEPTSGLDSDNAENLILILKKIAQTSISSSIKPIVLLSIHAPNFDMFNAFDQIYLLSNNGHNIYQGPPGEVVPFFKSFNFDRVRGNPAEFIIEVADGKFGSEKFESIAETFSTKMEPRTESDFPIGSIRNSSQVPMFRQILILLQRALSYYFIKVYQAPIRCMIHLTIFYSFTLVFKEPIGEDPFCFEKYSPLDNIDRSNYTAMDLIPELKLQMQFNNVIDHMMTMAAFTMLVIMNYTFTSSMIAIMLISLHEPIYLREISNSWYSKTSHFISKCLADAFVRFVCIIPGIYLLFYQTGASVEPWRIWVFVSFLFVLCTIWENFSACITIANKGTMKNLLTTIGIFVTCQIIDFIFIDFAIFDRNMKQLFLHIKRLLPLNNIFATMLISFFGFGRCSNKNGIVKSIDFSGFTQPQNMVNKMWYLLNFTRSDAARQADIFDLEVDYIVEINDQIVKWIGPRKSFNEEQPSYILSFFNYDDNYTRHAIVALTWLAISFVMFWLFSRKSLSRSRA